MIRKCLTSEKHLAALAMMAFGLFLIFDVPTRFVRFMANERVRAELAQTRFTGNHDMAVIGLGH